MYFTIKDIENLTGIKAHTFRIWEQRYGICMPLRKESNHRFYGNEELKKILRVATLYKMGHKVSAIAAMNEQQVATAALNINKPGQHELFINQLIESSIEFDQPRFEKLMHTLILNIGFEKCMIEVLFPFMQKIGMLWLTNHVVPAQEHFCSYLIQKKILVAIDGIEHPVKRSNRVILMFTPKDEYHEISLLFMQYLFKKHGIATIYLGKNASEAAIKDYCAARKVTHLYFHLITNVRNKSTSDMLQEFSLQFPKQKIVASGPAIHTVENIPANVRLLKTVSEMISFSKET
jgi:MerR family transcriptional regulator, light-induced transcriptional regulator